MLLDGFDLGVGILYGFAPDPQSRNLVMNSIAPIWDGNETWLVLGGIGLMAAFPLAFAIIMPAVYFPILIMLLALVFRGVAFEFRFRDAERRSLWDHGFCYGSALATFAQGVVLGAFIQGFQGRGAAFRRRIARLLHALLAVHRRRAAVRLRTAGRGLAGAQDRSAAAGLGAAARAPLSSSAPSSRLRGSACGRRSSIPTSPRAGSPGPISPSSRRSRWLRSLLAFAQWRALHGRSDVAPFAGAIGLFAMSYVGIAISLWPMIVPHKYTLWQAASSPSTQAFLLIGTLFLLPIILMYSGWSYWVFRGKVRADIGYH